MKKAIKKHSKIEKLSIATLYLSVIAYMILTLFTLTSCSSDDSQVHQEPETIAIPDANFELVLSNLGYDTNGINGTILKTDAEALTALDVSNKDINSLQGIEAFVNLTTLYCSGNNLESIDISDNINLVDFKCDSNQLTDLDIQSNTNLKHLNIQANFITNLELSLNTNLETLFSKSNNLESINTENNLLLEQIDVSDNSLNFLNLSENSALTYINVANNQLVNLDINNGNNSNITGFLATSNPDLACIQVDNETYSNTFWFHLKDAQASYSEFCL